MKTFLVLALAGACGLAAAQTPAPNPMPDGSRDMYVGLGAISAPDYQGGSGRRVAALPLLQLEWSNGIFVAGLGAGMHLSRQASLEYGPLLTLDTGRDQEGTAARTGGVTDPVAGFASRRPMTINRMAPAGNGLEGMDKVKARLQAGGFANYYLAPHLRLASSVLYGAGNGGDGLAWKLAVQHMAAEPAVHHRISLAAGLTLVNRSHNASFFGVTPPEADSSGHPPYAPRGGVRDIYLAAGWNWALSPEWMLATGARVTQLQGDARRSPLVQRATGVSISTGLAYRF